MALRDEARKIASELQQGAPGVPSRARESAALAPSPPPLPGVTQARSLGWYVIGWTLLLVLVLLLLKPKVSGSLGGLLSSLTGALKAWVEPKDPIAALEGTLRGETTKTGTKPSAGAAPAATLQKKATGIVARRGAVPARRTIATQPRQRVRTVVA